MDKIFSARIDESILRRIGLMAQKLHTSKKNVIETAVKLYAQKIETETNVDVLQQTCGAWKRKDSAAQLVEKAKKKFQNSMLRHQR